MFDFEFFNLGVEPEAVYNYDEDELSDSELLYNLGMILELINEPVK